VLFDLEGQFSILIAWCYRRSPDPMNSILEAFTRLCVMFFTCLPCHRTNSERGSCRMLPQIMYPPCLPMLPNSSFLYPLRSFLWLMLRNIRTNCRVLLKGCFRTHAFVEESCPSFPLFRLCTVIPSFMIRGLIIIERHGTRPRGWPETIVWPSSCGKIMKKRKTEHLFQD
jgi:hypothetical protein